jgi:ABC-type sugar transport system ATPase subunit
LKAAGSSRSFVGYVTTANEAPAPVGVVAEAKQLFEQSRRNAGTAEGRSVIMVSSEEEELLEIVDRVVVFRNGACDGEPIPETDLSVTTLRRHAWTHEA